MTKETPYVEDVRVLTPADIMDACVFVFQEEPFSLMDFKEQLALTIFAGRIAHYLFKEAANGRD